jgi:hypothetical protein
MWFTSVTNVSNFRIVAEYGKVVSKLHWCGSPQWPMLHEPTLACPQVVNKEAFHEATSESMYLVHLYIRWGLIVLKLLHTYNPPTTYTLQSPKEGLSWEAPSSFYMVDWHNDTSSSVTLEYLKQTDRQTDKHELLQMNGLWNDKILD